MPLPMVSVNVEVRITSVMLGLISWVWAFTLAWPGEILNQVFSRESPMTLDTLSVIMTIQGFLLIFGSLRPVRRMRQAGLALGTLMWFVNFSIFLELLNFWSLVTLLLLVGLLGLFNLVALWMDVCRKPREPIH